ncbi:MAG: DegV family EDD domain-containing protein [Desulfosarcina sp.]|nr:DegV family EDD domain-containing protein [Desulfosarcina sp.]
MREIDGRWLYYMFLAGTRKVVANQERLNRINVFPVKDGDTGANMAFTLTCVVESVRPERPYKRMLDRIAETALLNARGNSGIIFSQFLFGVSSETTACSSISIESFSASVKNAVRYIYQAVADPVEGTLLTIVRAWADFIDAKRHRIDDFGQLFIDSKGILEKTLAETPLQLDVLAKANVVDAGAGAFVYFIDGIIECIRKNNIRHLVKSTTAPPLHDNLADRMPMESLVPQEVAFRFCAEAVMRDVSLDHSRLSEILLAHGDSVVVAGAAKASRLHVHTSHPDRLFDMLGDYGTITYQKADDMLRQSQVIYDRKWKIALVTDSACDLSATLIDDYQIHMLPINIYFGDNHYLDKITMRPDQFYRRIGEGGSYPKTAQVNEMAFRNLYTFLTAHYDAIIAVHLTAKFSGTYFSSCKAAETISRASGNPIRVIDSKNVSGALGLIVLRIARAIEKGSALDAIVGQAARWVDDTRILVSVSTLKYMVRGGRVSPLKGLLANLLNLNPIVSMDADGNSMVFGKTFSQKANMKKVMAHVKRTGRNRPIWNYIIMHANNRPAADWYARQMKALTGKPPVAEVNISPVIGASAGLGAASVAFMFD